MTQSPENLEKRHPGRVLYVSAQGQPPKVGNIVSTANHNGKIITRLQYGSMSYTNAQEWISLCFKNSGKPVPGLGRNPMVTSETPRTPRYSFYNPKYGGFGGSVV